MLGDVENSFSILSYEVVTKRNKAAMTLYSSPHNH